MLRKPRDPRAPIGDDWGPLGGGEVSLRGGSYQRHDKVAQLDKTGPGKRPKCVDAGIAKDFALCSRPQEKAVPGKWEPFLGG